MSNKSAAIELYQQYTSGRRQFSESQLEEADLEDLFLSRVDLRKSNLNHANLKNADLGDADLRESSLIKVAFNKAHLSRVNLAGVNLSQANFTQAILNRANLAGANLTGACLNSATLIEANFSCADLSGASLTQIDLSTVNLEGAIYDDNTSFPSGFDPANKGMGKDWNLEELIAQFNHLCDCSNRYLGNTMTAKYFNSSRPKFDWLKQFKIDKSNQIVFEEHLSDSSSPQQLYYLQQWMKSFEKSCSQIIKGFPKLP